MAKKLLVLSAVKREYGQETCALLLFFLNKLILVCLFRCIRVNKFQRVDPDLLKACKDSGVLYSDLGLPKEITLWVDPWEVCCRYGEKNHAFTVVTFESDEDDQDDIPKKVSHAVDKVTSDYHSGSSSDEESGTKETRPTCWTAKSSAQYQVADYLYQPMLMYQFPRKKPGMFKGNDQLLPHFAHRFQQQGRNSKAFHQPPWLLSAARSDRYHWVHPQNLAHAH
nr:PREDICTED: protein BTG3-like [Latimeria chalumnae]|eukprot:XP_006010295.1 PREDICTED: protein BTG3-like [Latimeria chalumnae]